MKPHNTPVLKQLKEELLHIDDLWDKENLKPKAPLDCRSEQANFFGLLDSLCSSRQDGFRN